MVEVQCSSLQRKLGTKLHPLTALLILYKVHRMNNLAMQGPPLMNLNTNAQEPDEENPPLLCFLQGFNITTCYGCKKKFDLKLRNPPEDLILKRLVVRDRLINGQWVKGWNKSWAYFHLSVDCIRKSKSTLEAADVYIPNIILQQMHQQHVDFLIRKGWWSVMRKRPSV